MAAPRNPLETFVWGAGGQAMSPEQVARQREIAAALMQGGMDYSPVDHWLQGAARASQGLVGGLKERWAGEAEQRGREGFQSQWDSVFGGSASPVAAALAGGEASGSPISPSAEYSSSYDPASFDWSRYAIGGAASRPDSFTGLDQNYAARISDLVTAADAELGPGALRITSAYRSPELQAELYRDAVAKYGSEEAARKWVAPPGRSKHNSGLAVDFANSAGSLLRDPNSPEAQWIANNASRFGLDVPMSWEPWQVELPRNGGASAAAPRTQVAQAGATPSVAQLLSLAGNEWANPGQSSVVSALLGQAMQQQDPRYQQQLRQGDLDYQRSQLEFEAMMNPPAPAPEYGFTFAPDGSLIRTDKTSGGFDTLGQFASADDGLTDTQRNLSWRAEEAGLVRGTPEYNEFMRSGGQSAGMALTMSPDGTIQFTQGGASGGNLTEGQSKDSVYFTRASGALPVLDELENALLSYGEYAAGALPAGLGNFLQSEDYQVAQNAGKELLASILRKDTGAAVTPSEEALYGDIFLPRPGDKPATLARKRQARALAIEAIAAGMPAQAILNSAQALINAGVEAPNVPSTMQSGGQSTPPRFSSQAEFDAAPSGTVFQAPDGSIRVKP